MSTPSGSLEAPSGVGEIPLGISHPRECRGCSLTAPAPPSRPPCPPASTRRQKEIPFDYSAHLLRRHGEGLERGGVTLRSVIVGVALSLGIGMALPYGNMIIKGGLLGHNFNTPAAVFPFFLFLLKPFFRTR